MHIEEGGISNKSQCQMSSALVWTGQINQCHAVRKCHRLAVTALASEACTFEAQLRKCRPVQVRWLTLDVGPLVLGTAMHPVWFGGQALPYLKRLRLVGNQVTSGAHP
jgi:hypothetical protein